MSFAFIAALTRYPQQSYQQLLCSIREEMSGRYTQKPQLSACHRESLGGVGTGGVMTSAAIETELEFVA